MNRVTSLLAGSAAAAALLLGVAGPASASYPPQPTATIDIQGTLGAPAAGANVVFAIDEFYCPTPGTYTTDIDGNEVDASTTPTGAFEIEYSMPDLTAGTHAITFTCGTAAPISGSFTIDAAGNFTSITDSAGTESIAVSGGGGATLPETGSDSTSSTLQLAALAMVAGAGMLGLAAVRRRSNVAA